MNEVPKSARHYTKMIISMDRPEKVAFIGPGRHTEYKHVIEYSKRFCKTVHVYDKDPYLHLDSKFGSADYLYCATDVIFDKVDLSGYDLIVVLNQEKMYPVPKKHKGNFILFFGLKEHNGNCTTSEDDLGLEIEENYVFDRHRVVTGVSV